MKLFIPSLLVICCKAPGSMKLFVYNEIFASTLLVTGSRYLGLDWLTGQLTLKNATQLGQQSTNGQDNYHNVSRK